MTYHELMEAAEAYVSEDRPKLSTPGEVAAVMRPLVRGLEQESFFVVHLNQKHLCIGIHRCTVGLVDLSQVHAREVFREAIRMNASRVILVHNHPSGDPTPSAPDIACTRDLIGAGKIVGIEVLDHIIMGVKTPSRTRDWLSFREEGLL